MDILWLHEPKVVAGDSGTYGGMDISIGLAHAYDSNDDMRRVCDGVGISFFARGWDKASDARYGEAPRRCKNCTRKLRL